MEAVFLLNGRYFKTLAVPDNPPPLEVRLEIPRTMAHVPWQVLFSGIRLGFPHTKTEKIVYVAEIEAEHYAYLKLPVYVERDDTICKHRCFGTCCGKDNN